jgi:hypothetical protein
MTVWSDFNESGIEVKVRLAFIRNVFYDGGGILRANRCLFLKQVLPV